MLVAGGPARTEAIDVDSPASYFNWGFISISLPNLVLMGVMLVVFVAAVLLPFPFGHRADLPGNEDLE
jgi:hypothetical protein